MYWVSVHSSIHVRDILQAASSERLCVVADVEMQPDSMALSTQTSHLFMIAGSPDALAIADQLVQTLAESNPWQLIVGSAMTIAQRSSLPELNEEGLPSTLSVYVIRDEAMADEAMATVASEASDSERESFFYSKIFQVEDGRGANVDARCVLAWGSWHLLDVIHERLANLVIVTPASKTVPAIIEAFAFCKYERLAHFGF